MSKADFGSEVQLAESEIRALLDPNDAVRDKQGELQSEIELLMGRLTAMAESSSRVLSQRKIACGAENEALAAQLNEQLRATFADIDRICEGKGNLLFGLLIN